MTMTLDLRKYAAPAPARKPTGTLRRVVFALLVLLGLAGWIAALPALLGQSGLSWRDGICDAPGYRDPVTGRAARPAGVGTAAACALAGDGSQR
jgi:hypothetical protein